MAEKLKLKAPPKYPQNLCSILLSFPTIWFWPIWSRGHMVKVFCVKALWVRYIACQSMDKTGEYFSRMKIKHVSLSLSLFSLFVLSCNLLLIHTVCTSHLKLNISTNNLSQASGKNNRREGFFTIQLWVFKCSQQRNFL